jgi:inhibitor of cysteine peptidase
VQQNGEVFMRSAVLIAAVALAACAAPQEEAPTPPAVEKTMDLKPIAAPQPDVAALQVRAEDAGKTFDLSVGQKISVALVGVPTAGYLWAPAKTPAALAKIDETGGPTHEAQRQPGFTGGNHWEVFVFEAKTKGAGELVLEQRRPWETDGPPAQSFSIKVNVK